MNEDHHPVGRPSGESGTMTPPINSVSDEEIARAMNCDKWDADMWAIVNAVTDNDDHMSTEQAIALGLILAARRAANTPVSEWVYLVHDWEINEPGQRGYSYARTPERAERLAKNGVKLTPVYTRHPASDFSASPALPSQVVGLSVKPLEWGRDHVRKTWHGNVPYQTGPSYTVQDDGRWRVGDGPWVHDQSGDPASAKSACQLDFNARIQSCLTSPAAEPVATWGDAKTVGNLIAQLRTFDPSTPIYGAFHADAGDGRKARIRGLTLSRERVNGRLIDSANVLVPYAVVAWSAPQDASETHPAPSASREVTEADIERAAEVIWNDLYGARAGAWNNPPANSVSAIQIRATARAALLAALPEREG